MKLLTIRTRCWATHYCAGCDERIPPRAEHLEHHLVEADEAEPDEASAAPPGVWWTAECLPCAARNGRAGVAEPDVPEQPILWDGIA